MNTRILLEMLSRTLSNLLVILFFFQAEDGIRDLVRSRGLGDVYKRQGQMHRLPYRKPPADLKARKPAQRRIFRRIVNPAPVSYTHLTLPTSDLV